LVERAALRVQPRAGTVQQSLQHRGLPCLPGKKLGYKRRFGQQFGHGRKQLPGQAIERQQRTIKGDDALGLHMAVQRQHASHRRPGRVADDGVRHDAHLR